MPRKINIASADYPVGTFTIEVNGFNSSNTSEVVISFSRVSWPLTVNDLVLTCALIWSNGAGAVFGTTGGIAVDRAGAILTLQRFAVKVPNVPDGAGGRAKAIVNGLTATITMRAVLRTAIVVEAV